MGLFVPAYHYQNIANQFCSDNIAGPLYLIGSYLREFLPTPHSTTPVTTTNYISTDFDVTWLAPQVAAWLETEFHELAPTFTNTTGKHLARYSREDLIAICGEVNGRALFNEIHPNAPPQGANLGGTGPKQYPVGVSNPSASQFFVVNRVGEDVVALHERLTTGGCFLFHGPQQSGKTTTFLQSLPLLCQQGYIPLFISMEVLKPSVHKDFFTYLAFYLATEYPHLPPMDPNNFGFMNFVKQISPNRNLILLVDEFDRALELSGKEELLTTLRFITNSNTRSLQAFAGIGTYAMIELVGSTVQEGSEGEDTHVSPFNLVSFCAMPGFSRPDHMNLHIKQADLPPFIEADIYALSRGKIGASVWLGDFALHFLRTSPDPSPYHWSVYKKTMVPGFHNTTTMRKMLSHLTKQEDKDLLYMFMHINEPHVLMPSKQAAGERLAACGAAEIDPMHGTIMPAAPIIQQVILFYLDIVQRLGLRNMQVPYIPNSNNLDIPSILALIVAEFNWECIADIYCTKQLRVPPFRGGDQYRGADEQVFQTEVLVGLQELLCQREGAPSLICLPETKSVEGRTRLDILIYNGASYVLELCANVQPLGEKDSIESHVKKTAQYALTYKSVFSYCINFVGFDFNKVKDWPAAGLQEIPVIINLEKDKKKERIEETIITQVHLIHVHYPDTAFGSPSNQDSFIHVSPEDVRCIPRH